MKLHEKLEILTAAAKYDVSCSSSGSNRGNDGGIGNAARSGICHSWTSDGRCLSLLKILLSNKCIYNCSYCVNSADNDLPRASFTPEEVADLTINFYRRNYIEGLFLSSAVEKSPTYTMERLYRTAKKLREEKGFHGYIHLKAIPGADYRAIRKAGEYADRMSVNIELPSEDSLKKLAPAKEKSEILEPMKRIGKDVEQWEKLKEAGPEEGKFIPAGWALNQSEEFPIEVNATTYDELIRIPGLGRKSASRIIKARRDGSVDYDFLKEIGVVLKRGKYFLTCKNEYRGGAEFKPEEAKRKLLRASGKQVEEKQLSLFDPDQFQETKKRKKGDDPLLEAVSGGGTDL